MIRYAADEYYRITFDGYHHEYRAEEILVDYSSMNFVSWLAGVNASRNKVRVVDQFLQIYDVQVVTKNSEDAIELGRYLIENYIQCG